MSGRAFADEMAILTHPAATYRRLASGEGSSGVWTAVRRPLATALLLGGAVSLMTTGTLTLRLVTGGALTWSFVPLFETASLFLVCARHRRLPFSRALDLFFAGRGVWALALVAFGTAAAFADPIHVYAWGAHGRAEIGIGVLLVPVLAWSAYVDLCFFHVVLGRRRGPAAATLVAQRAVAWTAQAAYFVALASAPYVARLLGR